MFCFALCCYVYIIVCCGFVVLFCYYVCLLTCVYRFWLSGLSYSMLCLCECVFVMCLCIVVVSSFCCYDIMRAYLIAFSRLCICIGCAKLWMPAVSRFFVMCVWCSCCVVNIVALFVVFLGCCCASALFFV